MTVSAIEGGFAITRIHLDLEASFPGITDEELEQTAEAAKALCPLSMALHSVPVSLAVTRGWAPGNALRPLLVVVPLGVACQTPRHLSLGARSTCIPKPRRLGVWVGSPTCGGSPRIARASSTFPFRLLACSSRSSMARWECWRYASAKAAASSSRRCFTSSAASRSSVLGLVPPGLTYWCVSAQ
ncbi:MAG: hypothetical protein KF729_12700 [Sandaracinaceae bacterium]|nr:hypothetical protein [Sandaracinaceae bacterium]